jgi:hypothetical protein
MQLAVTCLPQKISRKYIREAADFFAHKLMSSRLVDALTVHITFDTRDLESGEDGYVVFDGDDPQRPPRSFMIVIRPSLPKKTIMQSLAHEMVHVKQYAKGELKYLPRLHKLRYYNLVVDEDYEDSTDDAYWDSPWEIEAWGRAPGLYRRYQNHLRKK